LYKYELQKITLYVVYNNDNNCKRRKILSHTLGTFYLTGTWELLTSKMTWNFFSNSTERCSFVQSVVNFDRSQSYAQGIYLWTNFLRIWFDYKHSTHVLEIEPLRYVTIEEWCKCTNSTFFTQRKAKLNVNVF